MDEGERSRGSSGRCDPERATEWEVKKMGLRAVEADDTFEPLGGKAPERAGAPDPPVITVVAPVYDEVRTGPLYVVREVMAGGVAEPRARERLDRRGRDAG